MTINGVELNIDFTDADVLERIETKSEEVLKKCEELEKNKKNIKPAEGIRQECKILKDFLDYVFGENISEKVFGNKDSLRDCLKAYEDIINERNRQLNNLDKIVEKYSPERVQR